MKKIFIGLLALASNFALKAQLVNDGATIIVKPGATLFVETNVTNSNSGTITVEGTLEVQGDLTNNATMTTATGSLVKFSGTNPSAFKSNGTVVKNLEVSKSNQNVTLVDNLTVETNANFAATAAQTSKLVLGANDLTMKSGATFTGADLDEYVVADAAGSVVKETGTGASGSPFEYAVGDVDEYSPITATYAGTATSGTISVNVVDAAVSPLPGDASDFISRYWNVDATGYTSGYTNNLNGTYINTASDITGNSSKIKGASYDGTWSYVGANGTAPNVIGTVTAPSTKFTGTNFYGKVNLTAYLAGALPGGTTMTTNLTTLPLGSGPNNFPNTTPYSVSPWNAPATPVISSLPANTVDWILVEARDASNPATLLAQKSAFILSNGNIVNTDGSELTIKDANVSSHIALKHRNHLTIRTDAPLNLAASTTTVWDFTTDLSKAYTGCGGCSNANMRQIGSVFAMWGGNSNQAASPIQAATEVLYNGSGSDRTNILSAVGGTANANTAINNVYSASDVNLDKNIVYNGSGSDRVYILSTVGGTANANNPIKAHQ